MCRVGETGVGEMGIGETGVGEMGVGETGPNLCIIAARLCLVVVFMFNIDLIRTTSWPLFQHTF